MAKMLSARKGGLPEEEAAADEENDEVSPATTKKSKGEPTETLARGKKKSSAGKPKAAAAKGPVEQSSHKRKRGSENEAVEAPAAKKKRYPITHPRTLDMIIEGIEELRDPQGSSVQAIKNWILENYKVREDMMKTMLKRAFRQGMSDGSVTRPKGQGEVPLLTGRYKVGNPADREGANEPPPPRTNPRPARKKPSKGLVATKKTKKKGIFGKRKKVKKAGRK